MPIPFPKPKLHSPVPGIRWALVSLLGLCFGGCRLGSHNVSPFPIEEGRWEAGAGVTTPVPVFAMAAGAEVRRGLAGDGDIGVQAGWTYLTTTVWSGMTHDEGEDGEFHDERDLSDFTDGMHAALGFDRKKVLLQEPDCALTAQGGATFLMPVAAHEGGLGVSVLGGLLLGNRRLSTGIRVHAGMQSVPFLQVETPLMARFRLFRSPLWLELGLVPSYFYAEGTDNFPWPWQHLGVQWHFGGQGR